MGMWKWHATQSVVGHKASWFPVLEQWSGKALTWYCSRGGIVNPLLTENWEEMADIKVVLSLLQKKKKKKRKKQHNPVIRHLKRRVNHQPDRDTPPPPLVSSTRGKEEKELCCQSLVSYLTPVGPHHTQLGQGATLLLGGAIGSN